MHDRRSRVKTAATAVLACAAAAALSACAARSDATPESRPMATKVAASSQTLESTDERISQALKELASDDSTDAHRRVADEYYRRGVLDQAHEHYTTVTQRDPRHAASFDALARIWRDWGMPQRRNRPRLPTRSVRCCRRQGSCGLRVSGTPGPSRWIQWRRTLSITSATC